MNNPQKRFGTASRLEADIAFFPLILPPRDEYYEPLKICPEREQLLGIGNFHPIVAQRLPLWQSNPDCSFQGSKLEFSFVNFEQQYKKGFIDEYWDTLMFHIQKKKFPKYFVIAPQIVCEQIFKKCLSGRDDALLYYYHDPCNKTQEQLSHHYALVVKQRGFHMRTILTSPDQLLEKN